MYHVWLFGANMFIGRGLTDEEALANAREAYPHAKGSQVRIELAGRIIKGGITL